MPEPGWLVGKSPRGEKPWERSEKGLRRRLGGRRTPGSGNKGIKGDLHTNRVLSVKPWMVEDKSTTGKQVVVKKEVLQKLERQAAQAKMEPILTISFTEPGVENYVWAAVPLWRLEQLFALEARQARPEEGQAMT